eukprot:CAMPEP_0183351192 /NCGR_PEP_ID=MMETSP0164_2-20130417/23416_1 /TAXON_ID=221442 /ORGANISM="Coccolithus pelagicus ssp braarudi, Strain PLY182g" /LENGTH=122 /DNA_ID=CAMNT_0025523309 /DNA_START=133 /DNA_END=501 /DNA_ORIENTATION=-
MDTSELKKQVALAAAAANASNSDLSMDPVKLIASDGSVIVLDRRAAMVSGTIKAMLSGPGNFSEQQQGEIKFPEISARTLEKTVQYFYYKLRHTNGAGPLPEFKIEPEYALELLMAANYLDT